MVHVMQRQKIVIFVVYSQNLSRFEKLLKEKASQYIFSGQNTFFHMMVNDIFFPVKYLMSAKVKLHKIFF